MKGIKDLKGDAAAHATKSEDEKSTKSAKSSLKPGFDVKSKLKQDFEDPCSISSSDSCGATASDSDSSNVPSDVPNSSKSADTSEPEMEFKEKMERPSASKGSKWSEKRFDPEDEVKSVNNKKENSSKSEVSAAPSKNSTFFEKIIAGQASEKPEAKAATSKFETTKKASIYAEKAATSRTLSAGEGKIGKFGPAEKTPAKETKATPQKLKESKDHKDVKDKSKISSDIYEFKDNEEFSESAGSTVASKKPPDLLLKETAPTTPSTSESEPKLSKKAQLIAQRKQAQAAAQPLYKQFQQQAMQQQQQQIAASLQQDDVEAHIKTSIVTVPTTGKKRKKSLGKDEKTPPSKPAPASKKELIVAEDKPEKIEKKLETPPQKVTPSPQTSGGKSGPAGQRTPKSIPKPESTFDVLRKSPNFNMALQLKEEAAAAAQLAAAQLGMEYNSKGNYYFFNYYFT